MGDPEFFLQIGKTTAQLFTILAKDEAERTAQDREFLVDIARELSNSLEVCLNDGPPVVFRFL